MALALMDTEAIVREYYARMRSMDGNFYWSDPDWWRDERYAKVITAGPVGRDGFVIVGYGKYVDEDVASEICDIYCRCPLVLLPLLRRSLEHLRYPFGFQVLKKNVRAKRCFEAILLRKGLVYDAHEGLDEHAEVIKYRLRGPIDL